jgi:toxin ParE1/3/4
MATPALRDFTEIVEYIARSDPQAAERMALRIERAARDLAESPEMGFVDASLPIGFRLWPVGKYILFYQCDDEGITVARIIHGARDWPALFPKSEKP